MIRLLKLPLLVFSVALFVRLMVIAYWNFDGLYGQDAFAYHAQSVAIADRLSHGWSALPPFFWPNGFPVLGALAVLVLGEGSGGLQMLNVVLGSLLAVVVFLLGRDLWSKPNREAGEKCGLLAALFTALAGQTVLSSVVVMSDIAAAGWLTLGAWCLLRFYRSPQLSWWLTCAAGATAAAVVTRWASVLAVPVFVVIALIALTRARRPVLAVVFALTAALTVLAPQFLLVPPVDGFGGYFDGWHPLNAFARSFTVTEGSFVGSFSYRFPNGLFYASPFWHPALMPPTIGIFALLGVIAMWRSGQRLWLFLLVGWYGAVYLFMVGLPMQNLRFALTMWTPAVILMAVGVIETWRRWKRSMAAVVVLSLTIVMLFNVWWWNRFFDRAQQDRVVAEKVASILPDGGRVFAFGITLAVEHYAGAEVYELYNLDIESLTHASDGCKPTLLVVNRSEIEARWRDASPYRNLVWLEQERNITVVEEIGMWTIAKVGLPPISESIQ